nr:PREDICTED: probable DNA-directed RNA polymerases I, II, and III subunit RPABC3 [Bemisia tabaci]
MTLSCSEILSIYYLASVAIVSCFDYGQGDGSKDNAFEQNRNVQQNRPSNVAADLIHNKDAEDVASFKKLIGEAKQIFKDSEDECERSQDNHGAGNHFNLFVYASSKVDSSKPDTSKGSSSSSIVLLGDIFNVRDVVPDHDKFNDKISWVHLVSDNYKMDLILTAKDRPFSILPSDRFAVTFREDSKFIRGSKLPFRPGSFDAVMNGTLYKTLVSDNSIHPTKSVDILYISFGDSFLKLRAASGEFRYFKNCKQLFILFQKLAFK